MAVEVGSAGGDETRLVDEILDGDWHPDEGTRVAPGRQSRVHQLTPWSWPAHRCAYMRSAALGGSCCDGGDGRRLSGQTEPRCGWRRSARRSTAAASPTHGAVVGEDRDPRCPGRNDQWFTIRAGQFEHVVDAVPSPSAFCHAALRQTQTPRPRHPLPPPAPLFFHT